MNFYSLYILWLCSALFCHLPSLEALGIDIKADVSLALSIAASSMMVLGVLHGLQAALIHFKWLAPAPGETHPMYMDIAASDVKSSAVNR